MMMAYERLEPSYVPGMVPAMLFLSQVQLCRSLTGRCWDSGENRVWNGRDCLRVLPLRGELRGLEPRPRTSHLDDFKAPSISSNRGGPTAHFPPPSPGLTLWQLGNSRVSWTHGHSPQPTLLLPAERGNQP